MAKLRILLRAPDNTLFVGKQIMHLQKTESTNNVLKNMLGGPDKPPEGLLVFAEEQSAGKGQGTNSWLSEAGKNITLSILFYPVFLQPNKIFYFNKAVALAVCEVVKETIKQPALIKWPNDILIGTRKVAGILIENSLRVNHIENSIVGIGINVHQSFAENKSLHAVSIKEVLGDDVDISDIVTLLCSKLEKYYLMLRRSDFREIDVLYQSFLFGLGEMRNFVVDGNQIQGKIKGVSENGKLKLETEGILREFDLKQIIFLID